MPFGTQKKGKRIQVVNKDTGRVLGSHPSAEKAQAQLAALYANGAAGDKPKPQSQ